MEDFLPYHQRGSAIGCLARLPAGTMTGKLICIFRIFVALLRTPEWFLNYCLWFRTRLSEFFLIAFVRLCNQLFFKNRKYKWSLHNDMKIMSKEGTKISKPLHWFHKHRDLDLFGCPDVSALFACIAGKWLAWIFNVFVNILFHHRWVVCLLFFPLSSFLLDWRLWYIWNVSWHTFHTWKHHITNYIKIIRFSNGQKTNIQCFNNWIFLINQSWFTPCTLQVTAHYILNVDFLHL